MGNNQAYTFWERQVIDLYNAGKLDVDTLDAISSVYSDTDIDSGGEMGLEAHDGLMATEIVVKLISPHIDQDDEDAFSDELYRIIEDRWGWR